MSILPKLSERDRAVLNSIFNPSMPLDDTLFESECDIEDKAARENKEILDLELSAIQCAEAKNFTESLTLFENLILLSPNRAASYNNRAQVYRLMNNTEGAFNDLSKAIELGKGNGRILKQAYCQRGILYRKEGKEEAAKADFNLSAKLGSPFAKQQLVEMNPYAALCNQMLSKAIHQLK